MQPIQWDKIFGLGSDVAILEIIVRGSAVYLGLFGLLRFVLKRGTSQLGISDLLVIVLIADAAQNAMSANYHSVTAGLILVCTILFWAYFIDWLGYQWPSLQGFVRPPELLLIHKGKIIRKNMRRELITDEELMSQLRLNGCEKIEEVEKAYMEGDGEISVIPKNRKETSGTKGRKIM